VDNGSLLHTPVRLIRFLPKAHPLRASSMSLGSRRLHSRPRLQPLLEPKRKANAATPK